MPMKACDHLQVTPRRSLLSCLCNTGIEVMGTAMWGGTMNTKLKADDINDIPFNVAINGPKRSQWLAAMGAEYNSIDFSKV